MMARGALCASICRRWPRPRFRYTTAIARYPGVW